MKKPIPSPHPKDLDHSNGVQSPSVATSYVCTSCNLPFSYDEVRQDRFFPDKNQCARCVLAHSAIDLPDCYGISYDGADDVCNMCMVRQACLIQKTDTDIWKLTRENPWMYRNDPRVSQRQVAVHILKNAGRPMHVRDIEGLMLKYPVGRPTNLGMSLDNCPVAVRLGDWFYVWVGCWDGDDGNVGVFDLCARSTVKSLLKQKKRKKK